MKTETGLSASFASLAALAASDPLVSAALPASWAATTPRGQALGRAPARPRPPGISGRTAPDGKARPAPRRSARLYESRELRHIHRYGPRSAPSKHGHIRAGLPDRLEGIMSKRLTAPYPTAHAASLLSRAFNAPSTVERAVEEIAPGIEPVCGKQHPERHRAREDGPVVNWLRSDSVWNGGAEASSHPHHRHDVGGSRPPLDHCHNVSRPRIKCGTLLGCPVMTLVDARDAAPTCHRPVRASWQRDLHLTSWSSSGASAGTSTIVDSRPREALANCASRVVQACAKGRIDQTSTDLANGADGLVRTV
jgi:hypothetical protein